EYILRSLNDTCSSLIEAEQPPSRSKRQRKTSYMASTRNMVSNLVAPLGWTKRKRGAGFRDRPIILLNVLGVSAFCLTWTLVTERGWVSTLFLPSPFTVAREAASVAATHELWWAIAAS